MGALFATVLSGCLAFIADHKVTKPHDGVTRLHRLHKRTHMPTRGDCGFIDFNDKALAAEIPP